MIRKAFDQKRLFLEHDLAFVHTCHKHPAKLEPNFLKVNFASQSRLDPEAGEAALLPVSVEEAVLEGRPGPEVNLIIFFFHPKAIVIPTLIGSHASGGGRDRGSLARSEYLWQ